MSGLNIKLADLQISDFLTPECCFFVMTYWKNLQLLGALPPDPYQGLCPWTPLGAYCGPQTPASFSSFFTFAQSHVWVMSVCFILELGTLWCSMWLDQCWGDVSVVQYVVGSVMGWCENIVVQCVVGSVLGWCECGWISVVMMWEQCGAVCGCVCLCLCVCSHNHYNFCFMISCLKSLGTGDLMMIATIVVALYILWSVARKISKNLWEDDYDNSS